MPTMNDNPRLTRARNAWRVMKRRCLDQNFKDFSRYGGSGIKVCPQWRSNFEQFLKDVGLPPSKEHWLGRLDTSGHYTPENTRWTVRAEQINRRQFCRKVIVDGEILTAAQAARLSGQPTRNTVLRRMDAGFSLDHPKLPKLYKRSMWLTFQGETLPLPELAKRFGLPPGLVWHRVKRGLPLEEVFSHSTPRTSPTA